MCNIPLGVWRSVEEVKISGVVRLRMVFLAKGPLPLGIAAVGANAEEIEIIEL